MSNPQDPIRPTLEEVREYLSGFQSAAKPPQSAARAAKHPDALPKYRSPHEALWRHRVVRVSIPICLFFLVCAVLSLLMKRSITPLHFGSHTLIEWALLTWPSAYPIAVLHCLALAATAGGFAVAAGGGHMEIPGTPNAVGTIVSRRTARFAYRQYFGFLALASAGIALHLNDWRFVAAVFESAAVVCLLDMVATLWVPVWRMFLVIELDLVHDGLMNRIVIGHGRGWRSGTLVIPHDQLHNVTSFASPLEAVFGLRSLRIEFWEGDQLRTVTLRAFGLANMVSETEHLIKGQFRSARGTAAIRSGGSLQPPMTIVNR